MLERRKEKCCSEMKKVRMYEGEQKHPQKLNKYNKVKRCLKV